MTLTDYLRADFASFEEWRTWSADTLSTYIDTLISQYRREKHHA